MNKIIKKLLKEINTVILYCFNSFNNSKHIQFLLLFLFIYITYFLLHGHVLYRDDARPLLIATYNHTFLELFNAMRYDCGPILYHLLLWLIAKFIPLSSFVVKAFHLMINILILITLLFLIKLPNIFRLLILLQSPFIGYTMYVRRYTLAVLLILLFAYFYTKDKGNKIWIYLVLFLLSQTTPHGFFISLTFFIFLVLNKFQELKLLFHKYYLIPLSGFLFFAIQLIPPSDLIQSGIKEIKPFFRNENIDFFIILIHDIFLNNLWIGTAFIYITCLTTIIVFQKNKLLVKNFLFCITVLFIIYFFSGALKYPTINKHHWLFSYAIISFLIIMTYPIKKNITNLNWLHYGLILLLIYSTINFVSLIPKAKRLSSNGRNVAIYLDKNFPEKEMLTKYEYFIEPIVIYRKKWTPYYALGRQAYVQYVVCNHESADFTKFKDLITIIKFSELLSDLNNTPDEILIKEPVLILSAHEYVNDIGKSLEKIKIKNKHSLKFLKEFSGAKYDDYIIYLVENT